MRSASKRYTAAAIEQEVFWSTTTSWRCDGRNECRRTGPQPALHRGNEEPAMRSRSPRFAVGGRVRNRFHQTIPASAQRQEYAIPKRQWRGASGSANGDSTDASHRYIAYASCPADDSDATTCACDLLPSRRQQFGDRDPRSARALMTTMGMTPQTGLPQNNRVGDFDPFALPLIMEADRPNAGRTTLPTLASESGGLLGLSGIVSGDMFAIWKTRPTAGDECRCSIGTSMCLSKKSDRHLGGMIVALGGVRCTSCSPEGIGENGTRDPPRAVCRDLEEFGHRTR